MDSPAFPRPVQNAQTGSGTEQHTPLSIQKASDEYQTQTVTSWPPGFSAHTGNMTRDERGQRDEESVQHLLTAVLIIALRQC